MSETRTPYIRMDGTRKATVFAQDKYMRTSLYNQFVATKRPDDEWPAWREANGAKKRGSVGGRGPSPFTPPKPGQHPDGYCDPVKAQITLPGSRPPRVVKSRVMVA